MKPTVRLSFIFKDRQLTIGNLKELEPYIPEIEGLLPILISAYNECFGPKFIVREQTFRSIKSFVTGWIWNRCVERDIEMVNIEWVDDIEWPAGAQ